MSKFEATACAAPTVHEWALADGVLIRQCKRCTLRRFCAHDLYVHDNSVAAMREARQNSAGVVPASVAAQLCAHCCERNGVMVGRPTKITAVRDAADAVDTGALVLGMRDETGVGGTPRVHGLWSSTMPPPGGEDWDVATLVSRLSLLLGQRASPDPSGTRLGWVALFDHLARLRPDARAFFNAATAPIAPALRRHWRALANDERATRTEAVELHRLLQQLQCVLRNADDEQRDAPWIAEQLRMRYADVDVAALTAQICNVFTQLADERDICFDVLVPDEVHAQVDAEKYTVVLLNLLFNAFKYTTRGGTVSCTLHEDGDGDLVLSVADNGPGIPTSLRDALFDRHRQLNRSVFLRVSDIGFSLAVSRDFAMLHGGNLTLVTPGPGGTMFRAVVPQAAPIGTAVEQRPYDPTRLATDVMSLAADELVREAALENRILPRDDRPLILLVDDSRSVQRVLIDCLEPEFIVASALGAVQGLAMAKRLAPDLIVTELGLPDDDGESMIASLRGQAEFAHVPVLILTAEQNAEKQTRLLERSVQDVLRKPFLLAEVRARVRNLIAAKKARDVLERASREKDSDLVGLANQVTGQKRDLELAFDEVKEARKLAENASRVKSNFLRMMSHELRTPITAMKLHLELLRREKDGADPRSRDRVERVTRAMNRLTTLIDTVLECARAENGTRELTPHVFDVSDLVEELRDQMAPRAALKGLELAVTRVHGPLPPLASDRQIVKIVIANMLERAIDATHRGAVRLHVSFQSGTHRIVVKDEAPKLTSDERLELFDPMRNTADLRWREGAGSGLGLYIVRDIARSVGGEIRWEDDVRGNAFTLVLANLSDSVAEEARARTTYAPPGAL